MRNNSTKPAALLQQRAQPDTFSAVIDSPIGRLGIVTNEHYLLALDFLTSATPLLPARTALAQKISMQLKHYFTDPAFQFTVPVQPHGTPFQQKVWSLLQAIPAKQTKTYGEAAKLLNTSPRAIGNACRNNPIPVIIPCHRIIASNGLGGYAGYTNFHWLQKKHWLLEHEKSNI